MHQMKSGAGNPSQVTKLQGKKPDEKHAKKRIKFATPLPHNKIQDKGKQINIVRTQEYSSSSESENEMSETTLPHETSASSDGGVEREKYFDLLSSTSEDNNSNTDLDGDE